jgi:RNA polymerase sigma factor (sigma-70 family)
VSEEPTSSRELTTEQQRLVTEHHYVARRVTRRFSRRLAPFLSREDIEQSAQLGLVKAARSYRRQSGVPFAGFSWNHSFYAVLRAADREGRQRRMLTAMADHMLGVHRRGNVLTDTPEVARAELLDHAAHALVSFLLTAAGGSPAQGAEEQAIEAERRRVIRNAVAGLRDDLRPVVELHHFEGLDLRDVAERLGLSYTTVRRRLDDACAALALRLRILQGDR